MTFHNALARTTFCLSVLFMISGPVFGQSRWDAPSIVTTNCSGCHGIDGNTELRYFPKVAGLDATYAEKKMAGFKETPSPSVDELYSWIRNAFSKAKKNSTGDPTRNELIYMIGPAHTTKPEAIKQAALWYAKQRPAPGRTGDQDRMREGQELFAKGVPGQNVLPCVSCHGQDAEGQEAGPRLAGQNPAYIEAQMGKFRNGDRRHAPVMSEVSRDLTPEQARAIAVYLASR